MTDTEITALARKYAEEMIKGKPSEELPNCLKNSLLAMNTEYIAEVFQWLMRRFCLVERSKFEELKIARRAKEHGAVWLNQWEAESLFPEIAKEVEE